MGTTNYYNTFIAVAEDCPVASAEVPQPKGDARTVAVAQYEMIAEHPYRFTSDDVIFEVFADRQGIDPADRPTERERFFAKGQPCLRSSPLGKRYGWGTHHDAEGKVAVVAVGSEEYLRFASDERMTQTRAMRSKRV